MADKFQSDEFVSSFVHQPPTSTRTCFTRLQCPNETDSNGDISKAGEVAVVQHKGSTKPVSTAQLTPCPRQLPGARMQTVGPLLGILGIDLELGGSSRGFN